MHDLTESPSIDESPIYQSTFAFEEMEAQTPDVLAYENIFAPSSPAASARQPIAVWIDRDATEAITVIDPSSSPATSPFYFVSRASRAANVVIHSSFIDEEMGVIERGRARPRQIARAPMGPPRVRSREERPRHLVDLRWVAAVSRLSKGELATLFGVTRQTIYNWEQGAEPRPDYRRRVAHVREIINKAIEYQSMAPADWLIEPRGLRGVTPLDLMKAGDLEGARRLAISSVHPAAQVPGVDYRSADSYRASRRIPDRSDVVTTEEDTLPFDEED